jgi:hypothetical protein
MSTLMKWLPQLKAAFAHVVPVASGMNWTTPYAESNFTYPSFAQIISNQTGAGQPVVTSGPSASVAGLNGAASGSVVRPTASGSGASGSAAPSGGAATSSRAAGWKTGGEAGVGGALFAALLAWATL